MPYDRIYGRPYSFYIERVIPKIGAVMLGNPDNYRMLGKYTKAFGDGRETAAAFRDTGLDASYRSLFGGCASLIVGRKL
jgi:ubiquinone/menaquinone biosynthesis C-methylase UbiE